MQGTPELHGQRLPEGQDQKVTLLTYLPLNICKKGGGGIGHCLKGVKRLTPKQGLLPASGSLRVERECLSLPCRHGNIKSKYSAQRPFEGSKINYVLRANGFCRKESQIYSSKRSRTSSEDNFPFKSTSNKVTSLTYLPLCICEKGRGTVGCLEETRKLLPRLSLLLPISGGQESFIVEREHLSLPYRLGSIKSKYNAQGLSRGQKRTFSQRESVRVKNKRNARGQSGLRVNCFDPGYPSSRGTRTPLGRQPADIRQNGTVTYLDI